MFAQIVNRDDGSWKKACCQAKLLLLLLLSSVPKSKKIVLLCSQKYNFSQYSVKSLGSFRVGC